MRGVKIASAYMLAMPLLMLATAVPSSAAVEPAKQSGFLCALAKVTEAGEASDHIVTDRQPKQFLLQWAGTFQNIGDPRSIRISDDQGMIRSAKFERFEYSAERGGFSGLARNADGESFMIALIEDGPSQYRALLGQIQLNAPQPSSPEFSGRCFAFEDEPAAIAFDAEKGN